MSSGILENIMNGEDNGVSSGWSDDICTGDDTVTFFSE